MRTALREWGWDRDAVEAALLGDMPTLWWSMRSVGVSRLAQWVSRDWGKWRGCALLVIRRRFWVLVVPSCRRWWAMASGIDECGMRSARRWIWV